MGDCSNPCAAERGRRRNHLGVAPGHLLFLRFAGIDYDHDPEAPQKLDAFICWVQQTTARHDGYLVQLTIGDKGSFLYIAFGAIIAHDDDALRAVRTAENIINYPQNSYVSSPCKSNPHGPARTGSYGSSTRRSYSAIGNDVVLAARLMMAAPIGGMRCSHSIYRQTGNKVDFEILPPVRVEGRTERSAYTAR